MAERLTDEQLAVIRARVEAATPGEWSYWTFDVHEDWEQDNSPVVDGAFIRGPAYYPDPEATYWRVGDAAFVAFARTDVPALLDEIDALRSERDDLQRALRQCAAHCANLTGEDKEDFAELDRTTAVPLLEVGELVSDTIAGLEFEAAQKDATAITAAVAEERERCASVLQAMRYDEACCFEFHGFDDVVKEAQRRIRAIEEQPNA